MTYRLQDLSPAQKRARLKQLLAQRATETRVAPLSFAQERLWFLEQLVPHNAAYYETGGVRVHAPVKHRQLWQALRQVIRRQEILRTTFSARDGQPRQIIHSEAAIFLPLMDLRGL